MDKSRTIVDAVWIAPERDGTRRYPADNSGLTPIGTLTPAAVPNPQGGRGRAYLTRSARALDPLTERELWRAYGLEPEDDSE